MYFLQAAVTMDIAKMPFEHLISVLSFFLVMASVVFINGFSLRLGDKELHIGGVRRLLARKDEDTLLKEGLKRFSDDADHETEAALFDLIEDLDAKIEGLALSRHCYFTFEKFIAIFKNALMKRVRRNNLKEKLAGNDREKYAAALLREIEEKHELMYAKIALVQCGDTYRQFAEIKEKARELLRSFFDDAVAIIAASCRKKIGKYNEAKGRFKTQAARKSCCDDCIEKNKRYIETLTGEVTP
jgi:hypothetical protein